jgi:hypothetical protein
MTARPSRAEILAALQDKNYNPLASRVAEAMTAYRLAFEYEARRRGSLELIELLAPTDGVEAFALEIFLLEIRAQMPNTAIKIKGDE